MKNSSLSFPRDTQNSLAGFEVVAHGATEKGLNRTLNEDSYLLFNTNPFEKSHVDCLLAVAAGLGQGKYGQIASQMAVDILRNSFRLPSIHTPQRRLNSAFEITNQRILNQSQSDSSLARMAATLTAVYIKDETAYIAHLGNSRVYLIRDGEIRQMTKDHTLAQTLTDMGDQKVPASAYKTVTNFIGNNVASEVWEVSIDLEPNDLLLIVSNGLASNLNNMEIKMIVEANESNPEKTVKTLIREAREFGGCENMTAILAKFRFVAKKLSPDPFEDKKKSFKQIPKAA